MNLKDFTYGLIILIIPLILIVVLHRFYISHKCHQNKECIKRKLLIDIDSISDKLSTNLNFLKNNKEDINNEVPEEEIEGFFGGISDWLYGKVSGAPVDPNATQASLNMNPSPEALKAADSSENSVPKLNSKFPNENTNDSSNQELLDSINKKKDTIKRFTTEKLTDNNMDKLKDINSKLKSELNSTLGIKDSKEKSLKNDNNIVSQKVVPSNVLDNKNQPVKNLEEKKVDIVAKPSMSMFKECNFYSEKCPTDYSDFGSIGLTGVENNVMLNCGNVENTKPAKAIAKIKNNSIEEVIVLDKGHGYNPDKPPKITVVGGKGNGGHCESIVDDDGYLSLIKVIHPGNYYTETPNIIIESPLMNSNCHFCCKLN